MLPTTLYYILVSHVQITRPKIYGKFLCPNIVLSRILYVAKFCNVRDSLLASQIMPWLFNDAFLSGLSRVACYIRRSNQLRASLISQHSTAQHSVGGWANLKRSYDHERVVATKVMLVSHTTSRARGRTQREKERKKSPFELWYARWNAQQVSSSSYLSIGSTQHSREYVYVVRTRVWT